MMSCGRLFCLRGLNTTIPLRSLIATGGSLTGWSTFFREDSKHLLTAAITSTRIPHPLPLAAVMTCADTAGIAFELNLKTSGLINTTVSE